MSYPNHGGPLLPPPPWANAVYSDGLVWTAQSIFGGVAVTYQGQTAAFDTSELGLLKPVTQAPPLLSREGKSGQSPASLLNNPDATIRPARTVDARAVQVGFASVTALTCLSCSATQESVYRAGQFRQACPKIFRRRSLTTTQEEKMKVTIEGRELVIRLPLHDPPVLSGSGKTLVVASTQGNKKTEAVVNGQPVTIGVNAYITRPVR